MFLRGAGSQTRTNYPSGGQNTTYTGTLANTVISGVMPPPQGDAIRNIEVTYTANKLGDPTGQSGALYAAGSGGSNAGGGANQVLGFAASRVVPTDNENRPANYAVNYYIKY